MRLQKSRSDAYGSADLALRQAPVQHSPARPSRANAEMAGARAEATRVPLRSDVRRGYALTRYGDLAASTRQRFLQYRSALKACSIEVEPLPLLPNECLRRHFAGEGYSFMAASRAYWERVAALQRRPKPDFLWIQYDALPFVPLSLERSLYPAGVPRIYDFDDAMHERYDSKACPLVRMVVGRKLDKVLAAASLAICGNGYLANYASRFCRTEIVPTVLDTSVYRPCQTLPRSGQVVVGWIGSPSTWDYVRPLFPLLERLQREGSVRVRAVGSWTKAEPRPQFEFVEWTQAEEVGMIRGMDIGIMPLPDDPWTQGKCGYKLIQYMSCGIPVVASPVGANREIVDHDKSGFFASDLHEWELRLRALIESEALRRWMGAEGRRQIVENYSLAAHGPRLATNIRGALDAGARAPR